MLCKNNRANMVVMALEMHHECSALHLSQCLVLAGQATEPLAKLELSGAEVTVHYYAHFESPGVLTIN